MNGKPLLLMDWMIMSDIFPSRGDIWLANLNPTIGREQSGLRPCLVVSVDQFNHGPAELVIVVPLTSRDKSIPLHVRVAGNDTGLNAVSFIKTEDVRSVSRKRLVKKTGTVSGRIMDEVIDCIKILLDIS